MDYPTVVIGGGIAGITAAVELAETGRQVVLVEKHPWLGGQVTRFGNYFPKLCPPSCGLEIHYRRIRNHPLISWYTGTEVKGIGGKRGDFRIRLAIAAEMINERCTACGRCAEVCPTEPRAAGMEAGLSFPMKYHIDPGTCLGASCARCVEECPVDAIRLDAKERETEIRASAVIVASGWRSYDPSKLEQYAWSDSADVLSNMEFEDMLAACREGNRELVRPSDGRAPGRIAFVQCAGSRDERHLPYCSAVCCSASLKHALTLSESYPEIHIEIFYIDLRLTGRNERLLQKAETMNRITLTKGKVGRITCEGEQPVLEVEDIGAGKKRKDPFDLVVLATGMVPNNPLPGLAVNEYGFLQEEQEAGIYPAATCKRPMDVSSSVKDATAAALKTMGASDG
jgi:quinone-modifying oxidoreductase subunit QmoA